MRKCKHGFSLSACRYEDSFECLCLVSHNCPACRFQIFCTGQKHQGILQEGFWRGFYLLFPCRSLPAYTFCHTVLWFVDSDFFGWQMIPYVLSNVIVMTGLCFIMNFFMEKHDNLIYGIAVHFCFNFLYCFLKVDICFYIILSVIYIVLIVLF